MKLSIIIPVYNSEKFLSACLDSCLNQFPFIVGEDYEIICINDGATDSSFTILKKYEQKGIIFLSQKNSGVSSARNNGLRHACGEYIWFVDSDDLIHPNILATVYDEIKKSGAMGCTFHYDSVSEDYSLDTTIVPNISFTKNKRIINNPVSIIFNRKYDIDHNLMFNTNMAYGEDTLWVYFLQLYSDNFIDSDAKLYFYRQVSTSAMHQKNVEALKKWLDSMLVMLNEYQNILSNWPVDLSEMKHNETEERMFWTVQNVIMGASRLDKSILIETLNFLRSKNLFPFPFQWTRLLKNSKDLGSLKVNLLCFLFPFEFYVRTFAFVNRKYRIL